MAKAMILVLLKNKENTKTTTFITNFSTICARDKLWVHNSTIHYSSLDKLWQSYNKSGGSSITKKITLIIFFLLL